jgi:hypothetical protein
MGNCHSRHGFVACQSCVPPLQIGHVTGAWGTCRDCTAWADIDKRPVIQVVLGQVPSTRAAP